MRDRDAREKMVVECTLDPLRAAPEISLSTGSWTATLSPHKHKGTGPYFLCQ
jgi:hypothetical protein